MLSTTYARRGLSNNPEHCVPEAPTGQPPNPGANAEGLEEPDLPENIIAFLDNCKDMVHQESGPNAVSQWWFRNTSNLFWLVISR